VRLHNQEMTANCIDMLCDKYSDCGHLPSAATWPYSSQAGCAVFCFMQPAWQPTGADKLMAPGWSSLGGTFGFSAMPAVFGALLLLLLFRAQGSYGAAGPGAAPHHVLQHQHSLSLSQQQSLPRSAVMAPISTAADFPPTPAACPVSPQHSRHRQQQQRAWQLLPVLLQLLPGKPRQQHARKEAERGGGRSCWSRREREAEAAADVARGDPPAPTRPLSDCLLPGLGSC